VCGIAGAFGLVVPDRDKVERTLRLMENRGPDGSGVFEDEIRQNHVTLLHSRLSIIDLDPRANQPFQHDPLTLVYNGEIYNYLELRDELIAVGHRFVTTSDTEVLLHAYQEWGLECFDKLEGMWAFALIDKSRGELVLSRDRFGEKPLYYMYCEGTLYFGSEVKYIACLSGVRLSPDLQQVRRFLVNGYKSLFKQRATFFESVNLLPPSTVARVTAPDDVRPERYWTLTYSPQEMDREDAVQGARERLCHAIKIRLRADVPVAFCLSGGVDSTALASIARRKFDASIHVFSVIDSDERYNEWDNIEGTLRELDCEHHSTHTSPSGFIERLRKLIDYHDSPITTVSYYVHSFLSQAISEAGFKVAVSGTGADELFTGYYDHYGFWLAGMADRPEFPQLVEDWRQGYGQVVRNPVLQDPLAFRKAPERRDHIYLNRELFDALLVEPCGEDFYEETYSTDLLRSRMMNELFHESVPPMLHEDDLNSMHWSVENRSPFLDRELAEFLYSVPSEYLIKDGYAKWLLRSAAADFMPQHVCWDKRKRGFNASIDSLLDRDDSNTQEVLLSSSPVFDIVRRDALEQFLSNDMTDNSFSKFLFSFISSKLFLESELASGQQTRQVAA